MKVGINAFAVGTQGGGIETYLRNLIRGLGAVDPAGDYTLFLQPSAMQEPLPGAERMRRVAVGGTGRFGRVPFAASRALLREQIDVVHVQFAAPLLCPARIVMTLHDISYERYPQFFTPEVVRKLRMSVPLTLRRAAVVLTDSAFSKGDIVRRYALAPEKVVVAPLAADPIFRPLHDPARLAAVRARYGTGPQFILFVGDPLQKRKNVKTLIEAYVRLRRADATRHRLVLPGEAAYLQDETFDAVRGSGYEGDVIFVGHAPQQDLVTLFNAATLFVYPSLYEGFGLPLLEAMACGTPVIASNASAFPEVVGDAALMVGPLDVEALAGAMARVLGDADLREQLSLRGQERAIMFSWENTARIALHAYELASSTGQS